MHVNTCSLRCYLIFAEQKGNRRIKTTRYQGTPSQSNLWVSDLSQLNLEEEPHCPQKPLGWVDCQSGGLVFLEEGHKLRTRLRGISSNGKETASLGRRAVAIQWRD